MNISFTRKEKLLSCVFFRRKSVVVDGSVTPHLMTEDRPDSAETEGTNEEQKSENTTTPPMTLADLLG